MHVGKYLCVQTIDNDRTNRKHAYQTIGQEKTKLEENSQVSIKHMDYVFVFQGPRGELTVKRNIFVLCF